ncbi:hypothetical protein [Luteolibacter marinus]|uniref:hypothetical protein n=1 Tax=Luteolibacter marinus TaxID=2776705 RepID=UPI003CCDE649
METGTASGTLYWSNLNRSRLSRFISQGKPLLSKSFSLTLRTPQLGGHHCPNCGLTILRPDR